ncbi:MAG: hypothetical protein JJE09_09805 [Bacteroidia bacterium]|nr:hypothetical protein [Bacteroidia bacterium]
MSLRIFKYVWFFSLLATMAILFYVYASLPLEVMLMDGDQPISVSREILFYSLLGVMALINVLVFVVAKLFPETQNDFKTWFYGFIITLNLFFVTLVNFSGVYNSGEKFDYSKIGVLIYGSIGLIVLWSIAWPVYSLSRKFLSKQQV